MRYASIILFSFLLCQEVYCQKHMPFVIDNANVLTKTESNNLNFILNGYFNASNVEYAFFTIKSLNEKPIREYSSQIRKNLGIGTDRYNNGLIVLLAVDEKKIDINIGLGLQWQINDSIKYKILKEVKPHFAAGEFYEGIKHCLQRLYEPVKDIPWQTSFNSFKELGYSLNNALNKIIEFEGNSITKNILNINSNGPQFSSRFYINITGENGKSARLYYSKHMKLLVEQIVSGQSSKIYARVMRTGPVRLDLLGIQ